MVALKPPSQHLPADPGARLHLRTAGPTAQPLGWQAVEKLEAGRPKLLKAFLLVTKWEGSSIKAVAPALGRRTGAAHGPVSAVSWPKAFLTGFLFQQF